MYSKFAAGPSVDIRFTCKPDGTLEALVIRHNGGATCHNSHDKEIIEKFLKEKVPGFDGEVHFLDEGKTSEFYEEKKEKKQRQPTLPDQPIFDDDGNDGTTQKNRNTHDSGMMGV